MPLEFDVPYRRDIRVGRKKVLWFFGMPQSPTWAAEWI